MRKCNLFAIFFPCCTYLLYSQFWSMRHLFGVPTLLRTSTPLRLYSEEPQDNNNNNNNNNNNLEIIIIFLGFSLENGPLVRVLDWAVGMVLILWFFCPLYFPLLGFNIPANLQACYYFGSSSFNSWEWKLCQFHNDIEVLQIS